jgi:hypothetical protein
MLTRAKTTGGGKVVRFKRRQQKRNPRRPLEAVVQDFERWDAAAKAAGLNWSEFTRRALNEASRANVSGVGIAWPADEAKQLRRAAARGERQSRVLENTARALGMLSEKGASKNGAAARAKAAAKTAGRKG